jgi:hypothetical protein
MRLWLILLLVVIILSGCSELNEKLNKEISKYQGRINPTPTPITTLTPQSSYTPQQTATPNQTPVITPTLTPEVSEEFDRKYSEIESILDEVFYLLRSAAVYYEANELGKAKDECLKGRQKLIEVEKELNELYFYQKTEKEMELIKDLEYFKAFLDEYLASMISFINLLGKYGDSTDYKETKKFFKDFREVKRRFSNVYYYLYKMNFTPDDEEFVEVIDPMLKFENYYCQFVDKISGNWYSKYFYQVDPHDKFVVEITEKLTKGVADETEIKYALKNWVANNIRYKHDPNWKSDYVYPPSLTALLGEGDCDDFSVLLASMFMRAGIQNVHLVFVDLDHDGEVDHLTVGIPEGDSIIIWEPQYKGSGSVGEDVKNWVIVEYFDIRSFISNPPPNIQLVSTKSMILGKEYILNLELANYGLGDGYVVAYAKFDVYGSKKYVYAYDKEEVQLGPGESRIVDLRLDIPYNVKTRVHIVIYTYYNDRLWDEYESYGNWFHT